MLKNIAIMRTLLSVFLSFILMMIPIKSNDMNNLHPRNYVIRPASQAGRFYEADADTLRHEVDSLLALHAKHDGYSNVAALIVPHAGYVFSGNVAAAAYATLDPQRQYKRVFLIGPSHYEWLDGASVDTEASGYETPLGMVRVDHETCGLLQEADSLFAYRAEAHDREHCLEVQLPFLQRRLAVVPPIVPIIISTNKEARLRRIAEVLQPYFNDDNLFVISSDFSHYPSYDDAVTVDTRTRRAIESGDVEQFIEVLESNARSGKPNLATSACGEFAIITLMCMLSKSYEIRHLLYQNSGDTDYGDRYRVVGYHAFAICRHGQREDASSVSPDNAFVLSEADKQTLKEIAWASLRSAFDSSIPVPTNVSATLRRKCGAFVTLTKNGRLRGCIGHFGEDTPLHEMVAEMARAAAFDDPRFTALRKEELDDLEVEISVLTPMRRIYSADEFILHRHGIYIRKGYHSGTFLPQVADEVDWTKEEFLGHCSRDKAGLGWDGWRDAELYVYEAIVF